MVNQNSRDGHNPLDQVAPSTLEKFMGTQDTSDKVHTATATNLFDHRKGAEVRSQYQEAFDDVRKARSLAAEEAQRLGPGNHTLSNGDQVDVSVDTQTGKTTVSTRRTDGSMSDVTYSDQDPDRVSVRKQDKDGGSSTVDQNGTRIHQEDQSASDPFGEKTTDFSIDQQGRPLRKTSGPRFDQSERVTANQDGSTDERQQIYNAGVNPVYETKHCDPGFSLPGFPSGGGCISGLIPPGFKQLNPISAGTIWGQG